MVRFIIQPAQAGTLTSFTFTFHYGQIYYAQKTIIKNIGGRIYIPLWLDLLYNNRIIGYKPVYDLHSTMVRFII